MSDIIYSKLFECNIHGTIRVSPIALKIIDTPEFQRMRSIKQLGICHFIYPTAHHTRFEHSIGVYHLADQMVEKIRSQYPDMEYEIPEFPAKQKLNEKLAECIKIAALCHDIGHGPFSHIFDDVLLSSSSHPNRYHETRSCLIVEMLCHRELADFFGPEHISFIKSLIEPKSYHRGALYQIVANNLNGIDVDKFDYMARDSINLGHRFTFNLERLINEFIIDRNGNIAYPKHCSSDIYELFHTRYMMHKKVYHHKTAQLVDLMISDIFTKIDPIYHISETIDNMEQFCKLTDDSIFFLIQSTINPMPLFTIDLNPEQLEIVQEANEIYQRILSRNFYKQIAQIIDDESGKEFLEQFLCHVLIMYPKLKRENFIIRTTRIGFVNGNKRDPFETIYFYNKKENAITFTLGKTYISALMNNKIQESHYHLIAKNYEDYIMCLSELNNFILMSKYDKAICF